MWLNSEKASDAAIFEYRESLKNVSPKHIVIDGLFCQNKIEKVIETLKHSDSWQTQQHTYDALYVSPEQWSEATKPQRFVQRDVWRPEQNSASHDSSAQAFLHYLRGEEFMQLLSRIFKVQLTDINVANPDINTNYFRLSPNDFVSEHADDSPGREICMLLYLNKNWHNNAGGELVFSGKLNKPIMLAPLCNRCVLFDPSSEGSEHWVNQLNAGHTDSFRYNVTSWYWSE